MHIATQSSNGNVSDWFVDERAHRARLGHFPVSVFNIHVLSYPYTPSRIIIVHLCTAAVRQQLQGELDIDLVGILAPLLTWSVIILLAIAFLAPP